MSAKAILLGGERETKCRRLAEACPNCSCENDSVEPELSPGVVEETEILIRICPSPIFWDKATGKPTAAAFDEVATGGLSVIRYEHSSHTHLNMQIRSRLEAGSKKEFGSLASALWEEIKSVKINDVRAFCIYDTATPTNLPHADICHSYFFEGSNCRSKNKDLRALLREKFTTFAHYYDEEDMTCSAL